MLLTFGFVGLWDMAKGAKNDTAEQMKLFAYAYFTNKGNGTQAAIEAGYSVKAAAQVASRLLTYAKVQAILTELHDNLIEKAIVTKTQIAEELFKIGFSDIRQLYDENGRLLNIKDIPDAVAAALGGAEVDELWGVDMDGKKPIGETKKVKMWDKLKALAQLTDIYGYNAPTKVAPTDPQGNALPTGPFQVQIIPPKPE